MSELLAVALLLGIGAGILSAARLGAARTQVRLTFPRSTTTAQAVDACRSLTGLLPAWWRRWIDRPSVALEVRATPAGIEHLLSLPAGRAEYVIGAFKAALPGLRVDALDRPEPASFGLARELRYVGTGPLRVEASTATNAGLLAALQPLRRGESVVIQYVVAPLGAAFWPRLTELVGSLWRVPEAPPRSPEPELAVAVRIGVTTGKHPARTGQLMARVLGAFHPAGTPQARLVRCPLRAGS